MNPPIMMAERGWLPDWVVRWGIRRLCVQRLREQRIADPTDRQQALAAFIEDMQAGPVAPVPDKANEQHYEVPPAFFQQVLGQRLKYSSGYWPEAGMTLDQAEAAMLQLTCRRGELQDGMDVLDLGCGWGSLSLWIAEHYPACRITAVSNSKLQREHIEAECRHRGLDQVEVFTADMNEFDIEQRFDRVFSIEMFEHMRNYEVLLNRIAGWLKIDGKLFVHIFCHRELSYRFETEGSDDWMGRHFFTGGIMPANHTLAYFQRDLALQGHWVVDGRHYARTANAWLANQDARRQAVMEVLEDTYGREQAALWFQRWRMFFMACAELFGYRGGREWWVAHYLLQNKAAGIHRTHAEAGESQVSRSLSAALPAGA